MGRLPDWRCPVTRRLLAVVALAVLAVSCSKLGRQEKNSVREESSGGSGGIGAVGPLAAPLQAPAMGQSAAFAARAPQTPPPVSDVAPEGAGQVRIPQDRKLIRDVTAQLEVKSVGDALARLKSMTESAGGYVSNEQRSRDERGVGHASIVARVPVGKLDSLSAALKSVGILERFQVSANDITEEYFNLELQLRNRRLLEARLLELLKRPANKLSDLLDAERELARVRNDIDQMEGRQRFWDNRVALAALMVELHEPEPAVVGNQGGAWAALKHSFSEAADNFVLAIAGIVAFTGGLIPVIVALGIALALVVKWWRWRKAGRTRT
jgi:hypothetical protein